MGTKRRNRISDLPDDILCHILSFLPTEEAAITSALSKRWRNLFALSPNLCFDKLDFLNRNYAKYLNFVDRVLTVSENHSLKSFTLKGRPISIVIPVSTYQSRKKSTLRGKARCDIARVNSWICNVLSRRGLLNLHLHVSTCQYMYTLPLEVFSCKTLVNLELGNYFNIDTIPENASLPVLKTLFLDHVEFHNTYEALISACPVLEELTVIGYPCGPDETVSCPTLKRLTLRTRTNSYPYGRRSVTYDTPNLVYFYYADPVVRGYPFASLHSLVEAEIYLYWGGSHSIHEPLDLFKGLRNVEILSLSNLITSEVFNFFAELIPLFKNLSRLSIETKLRDSCSSWKLLPLLLKKSPNLQTLIIKGPLHFDDNAESLSCQCLSEYSFLSSCLVKVLEITEYSGTKGELEQIKHFLEKLPCLELVKIRATAQANLKFTTDLQMLPGACKIQLKVFHAKTK